MSCSIRKILCRNPKPPRDENTKKLYCGCEIHHKVSDGNEKYQVLEVLGILRCPKHQNKDAMDEDINKYSKKVKLYEEKLRDIEEKINKADLEDKGSLYGDLIDTEYELEDAKLEFFNLLDISCD